MNAANTVIRLSLPSRPISGNHIGKMQRPCGDRKHQRPRSALRYFSAQRRKRRDAQADPGDQAGERAQRKQLAGKAQRLGGEIDRRESVVVERRMLRLPVLDPPRRPRPRRRPPRWIASRAAAMTLGCAWKKS